MKRADREDPQTDDKSHIEKSNEMRGSCFQWSLEDCLQAKVLKGNAGGRNSKRLQARGRGRDLISFRLNYPFVQKVELSDPACNYNKQRDEEAKLFLKKHLFYSLCIFVLMSVLSL